MATNFIDIEARSPFQNQPEQPTGLNLQEAIGIKDPFAFGQQVENAALGREFAKLLDEGQQGMIDAANELIKEGSLSQEDLQGLDPNLPQFQSEQGQLAWYQSIEQQLKKNVAAKQRTELVGLEDKDLVDRGFELGADITGLREGRKEVSDAATVKTLLEKFTSGGPIEGTDVDPDETDIVVIQSAINTIDDNLSTVSLAGVGGDPSIKGLAKTLESKKKSLIAQKKALESITKAAIKEEGTQGRFDVKEGRLREEALNKAVERFLKDKSTNIAVVNELDELDKAFKELGLTDGLDSLDPSGVDIPGAGKFGKFFSRFVNTTEGVKVKGLIERLVAVDRHELFGATLTQGENSAFQALSGTKIFSNQKQLLEYLRGIRRSNKEIMNIGSKRQRGSLKEFLPKEEKDTEDENLTQEERDAAILAEFGIE